MTLKYSLAGLTVALALAVGGIWFVCRSRGAEPQDICDAAEMVEQMGLYWTTDSEIFPYPLKGYSTITISTEPITTEQAGLLSIGAPTERWKGKARAYSGKVWFGRPDDRLRRAVWGKVTMIGDPEVVERIISHR
jgi:hypothetical protein